MKKDASEFKNQMIELIYEASQVSRSITAITRMSSEYMDATIDSLERESSLYDATWVIQKLTHYQGQILETVEVGLRKIEKIAISESVNLDIPDMSQEKSA